MSDFWLCTGRTHIAKMLSKICLVVAAVLVTQQVVEGQICNALNPDLIEVDLTYSTLSDDNFTVIFPSKVVDGDVILVEPDEEDGTGGIAATFWHTEKRRIADGFKASFEWEYTGNSDGIAFLVQNDKVEDIEGITGAGLGYFNGLDRYIAVGIDVCPKLGRATRYPCAPSSDVEITIAGQGVFPELPDTYGTVLVSRSIFPRNTSISIDVYYLKDENSVAVFSGEVELARATLTGFTDVETHFGGRFGTFGFTSSNGFNAVDAGRVKVNSFTLSKFISEIRPSTNEAANFPTKVVVGKTTVIDIVVVDNCNEPSSTRATELNVTADKITAFLRADTENGIFDVQANGVRSSGPGTFTASFLMPKGILASWTLFAEVDSPSGAVEMQGVPLAGVVETITGVAPALPLYALILLISLLVILVLAMAYVIKRLYRYRIKLKENDENIKFGQEKEKIDKLEETVTYTMNPLMGTLEEMEEKLAANQKILEDLRKGDTEIGNMDEMIAQLKKQNKELRKELKKLKISEQKNDAMSNRASIRKYIRRGAPKQEFTQEKA